MSAAEDMILANLRDAARHIGLLSYNEPMRSLRGKLRCATWLFLLWFPAGNPVSFAQMQNQPQLPTPPAQSGGRPPFGQGQEGNQDPAMQHAMEAAA